MFCFLINTFSLRHPLVKNNGYVKLLWKSD